MTVKEFFNLFTSTKALIIAAVTVITIVNELRLKVHMYESKESFKEYVKESFRDMEAKQNETHKVDSLHIINLIEELSLSKGVTINYKLIESNTQNAVTRGFNNAIAYSSMALTQEKDKYDTLYYKTPIGKYYRVVHNIDADSVHKIEVVDDLPKKIKNI
jgi:hypothetical protein